MYTKTICIYGMHLPASSKGCCLNPKGWCIGTPYGDPGMYIYIYQKNIYIHTFSSADVVKVSSLSQLLYMCALCDTTRTLMS